MRAATAERFVCPLCRGDLTWEAVDRSGPEIRSAEALCPSCGTTSRVVGGIGYFFPGDAPSEGWPLAEVPSPPPPGIPGWAEAFAAARSEIGRRLGSASPPVLEVAFREFAPGLAPVGGNVAPLVLAERGALTADSLTGGGARLEAVAPDLAYVEVHSLPLRDRAYGAAVLGAGLQTASGSRVILREIHRVASERVLALVLLPSGADGASGPGRLPFAPELPDTASLLEQFRRCHWEPRMAEVGTLRVPAVGSGEPEGGSEAIDLRVALLEAVPAAR